MKILHGVHHWWRQQQIAVDMKQRRWRRKVDDRLTALERQGEDMMSKQEEMNAVVAEFKASLQKHDDAITALESAVATLKANQGDPTAMAAVDTAMQAMKDAKVDLDTKTDEMAKTAGDAVASGGPAG